MVLQFYWHNINWDIFIDEIEIWIQKNIKKIRFKKQILIANDQIKYWSDLRYLIYVNMTIKVYSNFDLAAIESPEFKKNPPLKNPLYEY